MNTGERITREVAEAAREARDRLGSAAAAAEELGCDPKSIRRRLDWLIDNPNDETILQKECDENGIAIDDVAYYWVKTKDVSMFVKRKDARSYSDMRDDIIAAMDEHSPTYPELTHDPGEHLLVVDPADVHIGKLSRILETGHDYDIDEAVRRVDEGVTELVARIKPFGVSKILLVIGNDILHIDHPHRHTTAGTPQDTSGQWWEMFREAKRCYVALIERLTQIADVHVVYCPSNHDYVSGFMLADSIQSWFRLNPNVHFGDDNRSISIAHRKYIQFGKNLIGLTHGDGAKEKDLPQIMQYEARAAWGSCLYGYWYVHHIHHKTRKVAGLDAQNKEKDHIGVTVMQSSGPVDPGNNIYVEAVRSPSPPDGWHDRNGYLNQQAIEVFLHHPDKGQIARFSHYF